MTAEAEPGLNEGLAVVFIDPLYDFLHPHGAFAKAYGDEKTATVRNILPELLELASASLAAGASVRTILVTSHYKPRQFRSCPTLCATSQGRQCMIPPTTTVGFDLVLTKTSNSLLDSAERDELLSVVQGRRVLVCGVTAAHCVKQAVSILSEQGRCPSLVVAQNVVGYTGRSGEQMVGWPKLFGDLVSVVPEWQQVLYPPHHYAYHDILVGRSNLQPVGEGDSFFLQNVLSQSLAGHDTLFDRVLKEVHWQKMMIRGSSVSRDVAIQVVPRDDGSTPIYRNPGYESLSSSTMSPTIDQIRLELQDRLGFYLNHVKIQLYKDGSASIGRHSDKTIDISHGSPIVNLSLGCQRTFSLTKKDNHAKSDYIMTDNSLFVLGWQTNRTHWHHVDKARQPAGPRISMVFRHIATHSLLTGKLCGQGAKREHLGGIGRRDDLIHAFSLENREATLRWSDLYLGGSDVIE